MSISSVSSTLFNYATQGAQSPLQQFKSEFDQLGQDLSSGNLSAAQSDFSALEQMRHQLFASGNSSPLAQAMSKLSQDLQSGNLPRRSRTLQTLSGSFKTTWPTCAIISSSATTPASFSSCSSSSVKLYNLVI